MRTNQVKSEVKSERMKCSAVYGCLEKDFPEKLSFVIPAKKFHSVPNRIEYIYIYLYSCISCYAQCRYSSFCRCYLFNCLTFLLYAQVYNRLAFDYYSHTSITYIHTSIHINNNHIEQYFKAAIYVNALDKNVKTRKPTQHEMQSIRLNFMPNTIQAHKHTRTNVYCIQTSIHNTYCIFSVLVRASCFKISCGCWPLSSLP